MLDFGLAKNVELISGDPETSPTLTASPTHAGEIMGTAAYMSPEQAAGVHTKIDARSDVFAAGILVYEMLSGVNPFAHGSYHSVVAAILERDPAPLSQVDPEVWRVIKRALEKSAMPNARCPFALIDTR